VAANQEIKATTNQKQCWWWGVFEMRWRRGGMYGGGVFVLFWGIKVCDKNDENKIRRAIRQPPDDKEHTTINQKMQWDGGGMGQDEQQGGDARGEQIKQFWGDQVWMRIKTT
jgi:hypothetical protein